MNSHFQSSETTSTFSGCTLDGSGLAGSRSWLPIHAMPPSSMTVMAGMDQTTSSIAPEYSQSGRYPALVLPRLNHHATAIVAIIVGMMIASIIAVELMRIVFSAAATGPTGSSTPRAQPDREGSATAAAADSPSAEPRDPSPQRGPF